jgi:hypothetical protein
MTHAARLVAIACTSAAALLAAPGDSRAGCFDWLFGCCHHRTTYRPLFPTFAARPTCCTPCCTPCVQQCVQYVPTTCYRTQCTTVPVTTCRPFTTCDPCTGCPVTVMRRVTTYVQQCQRVPYTTYRMVAAPVATQYAQPACDPCGAAATYGVESTTVLPETAQPSYRIEGGPTPEPEDEGPSTYEGSSTRFRVQEPIPDDEPRQARPPRTARGQSPAAERAVYRGDAQVVPAQHAAPAETLDDGGWRAARPR